MGWQRWQCDGCSLTAGTRNGIKWRRAQLAQFLDWLLEAALKRMPVNHHGLLEAHMRRACEWRCTMHCAKPDPARILKRHDRDAKTPAVNDAGNEPTSQPTLGTGIDWNESHTRIRYPNTTD